MRECSGRPVEPAGPMQDWQLTTDRFLSYAARWHKEREVVTRNASGEVERTTYGDVREAAARLARALAEFGVMPGDRVATLATNTSQHLICWYGIIGAGAVCHTLNPRLFAEQLVYIVNHAGDRVLFADAAFASVVEAILPQCPTVELVVVLDGEPLAGLRSERYSDFIAGQQAEFPDVHLGEQAPAGLCYTSGTTGNPKGVLYTHRSNYLHTLMIVAPDAFALSATDVVMPVVPMYHANAWGLAFAAPAVGAKLVLPGLRLDGQSLYELLEAERVTFAAGVPTVWQGVFEFIERTGQKLSCLRRVAVGGAACPEALLAAFERQRVEVRHAWGMTELSPVGLVAAPTPEVLSLPAAERRRMRLKQGRAICTDVRVVDEAGAEVPRDGRTPGRLQVQGPAVVARYYGADTPCLVPDGFFDTGDIAVIDPFGFVKITDREKDIIKSGGEWISSIEIENLVIGHPAVALAAVIGIPHPRWGERPRLYLQLKPGHSATADEILNFLSSRIAKWWLPDEIVFVDVIPLGATGKIDKRTLRAAIAGDAPVRST